MTPLVWIGGLAALYLLGKKQPAAKAPPEYTPYGTAPGNVPASTYGTPPADTSTGGGSGTNKDGLPTEISNVFGSSPDVSFGIPGSKATSKNKNPPAADPTKAVNYQIVLDNKARDQAWIDLHNDLAASPADRLMRASLLLEGDVRALAGKDPNQRSDSVYRWAGYWNLAYPARSLGVFPTWRTVAPLLAGVLGHPVP